MVDPAKGDEEADEEGEGKRSALLSWVSLKPPAHQIPQRQVNSCRHDWVTRWIAILELTFSRSQICDKERPSFVEKRLGDWEDSLCRVDCSSDYKGVWHVENVVSGAYDDHIGVLVAQFADSLEDMIKSIHSILLDHLQMRQRSLKKNLTCDEVKQKHASEDLHQHEPILVPLFRLTLNFSLPLQLLLLLSVGSEFAAGKLNFVMRLSSTLKRFGRRSLFTFASGCNRLWRRQHRIIVVGIFHFISQKRQEDEISNCAVPWNLKLIHQAS